MDRRSHNLKNMCIAKYGKNRMLLRKDVIADYWVFEGIFFADEYSHVHLKEDDVVLDVGANIGAFTIKVAGKVKKVIAVESEPQNFGLLLENIKINNLQNVLPINLAVSDKEEVVYFNATGGSAKVSKSGNPVQAKTLDEILDEIGNPNVTILKMDIEGYEGKVLTSFHKFSTIRQVIIETHSKDLTAEVTEVLKNNGFKVVDVSLLNKAKVLKNLIFHFPSFIMVEKCYNYQTSKQLIKYLFLRDKSPVAADNYGSEQKILYGFK
jgi:FkbM family methyltransferase